MFNMKKMMMKQFLLLFMMLFFNVITSFSQSLSPKSNEKGKWGYVNESGKWVIKPKYTSAHPFKYGVGCVEKDGRLGFVNEKGKELLKCRFEKDAVVSKDYIFVKDANLNNQYYIYDLKSNKKRDCEIKNKEKTSKGAFIIEAEIKPLLFSTEVEVEKAFFVVDKDGNVDKISCKRDQSCNYRQNGYFYVFSNGNVYTPSGKHVLNFENGLCSLSEDKEDGVIYGTRPESQEKRYWYVSREDSVYAIPEDMDENEISKLLSYGNCIVQNPKGGYILFYNNKTQSETYEAINRNNEDCEYKLYKDGKWDYLYGAKLFDADIKGSKENANCFKPISCSSKRSTLLFAVREDDGKFNLYDPKEKKNLVTDCDSMSIFVDSRNIFHKDDVDSITVFYKGGYAGLFNANQNKVVIPANAYSSITKYAGRYWVKKNGKEGMMTMNSLKLLIPCIYDKLNVYYDDDYEYVFAKSNGKMGVLDRKTGDVIVPCRYSSVRHEYGLSRTYRVSNGKGFGLFREGKLILPIKEYSKRYNFSETEFTYNAFFGIFVWDKNEKVGVIDFKGKQIIPFVHDDYEFGNGTVIFLDQLAGNNVRVSIYSLYNKNLIASKVISDKWEMSIFLSKYA